MYNFFAQTVTDFPHWKDAVFSFALLGVIVWVIRELFVNIPKWIQLYVDYKMKEQDRKDKRSEVLNGSLKDVSEQSKKGMEVNTQLERAVRENRECFLRGFDAFQKSQAEQHREVIDVLKGMKNGKLTQEVKK